jgi:hypothetical protein
MKIEERIDPRVAERVEAIVSEQSFVPVSPADYDQNGKTCLCAAGILAKAGLQVLHGMEKGEKFEAELANTKDRGLVYSVFETLGWSSQFCNELMTTNDITAQTQRPDMIRSCLRAVS